MKDSDLIFGLMASFSKNVYSFSDLRYLTLPFNVSASSLRTSLSRMSAAGTIAVTKDGRNASYHIADKGKRISRNVSRGFQSLNWSDWNHTFWGVPFSVPEKHADNRHIIRKKLSLYRFACFTPGFWIRPVHPDEFMPDILASLLDTGYCHLIRFSHHSEFTAAQADALWNLKRINAEFQKGLAILDTGLQKLNTLSPQQSLVEKMTVGNTIVNLLFTDPLLPPQFLPPDWKADALRDTFIYFNSLTTKQAQPYWEQIYRQEDTP